MTIRDSHVKLRIRIEIHNSNIIREMHVLYTYKQRKAKFETNSEILRCGHEMVAPPRYLEQKIDRSLVALGQSKYLDI